MNFFTSTLLACAGLVCVTGVSAQNAYTKVTGETCPAGQRSVQLWELMQEHQAACFALQEWDIARLANGASLSGRGYECDVKAKDTRTLGHALCVKAPPLPQAVGTFSWSVNHQPSGDTTLAADGTCSNTALQMNCIWKASNPRKRELTLHWKNGRFVQTLILSADGQSIKGTNASNEHIQGTRK